MECNCVKLILIDSPSSFDNSPSILVNFNGEISISGFHNGVPFYQFLAYDTFNNPISLFLYRDINGYWGINDNLETGSRFIWEHKVGGLNCPPYLTTGLGGWELDADGVLPLTAQMVTLECTSGYCCIAISYQFGDDYFQNLPTINNQDGTYTFLVDGETYIIEWDFGHSVWSIFNISELPISWIAYLEVGEFDCPSGQWGQIGGDINRIDTIVVSCGGENFSEDRFAKTYEPIYLPFNNEQISKGLEDCCCEELVLGHSEGGFKSDITPIWIKINTGGTATFKLTKNGQNTSYPIITLPIIKEPNGFCAMIDWYSVLSYDGAGCYKLSIEYNIAGVTGLVTWGNYKLMPYTTKNALYTARIKAIFNSFHEKDNIDFTDTNLIGTIRFNGFIGKRQPNTTIDNIIYGNREMKSVLRENLNTYEISTDPLDECIINPLLDLYLLHENQLFISDYNFHNHSYKYIDLPVILEESAEIEYYDYSRKATLTAKVSDKVKNDNNFYK